MSSWSSLCAQGLCHAGAGIGLLVPVKANCNATAYEDILYNCVLQTWWLQIGEEPHMGVMVRSPYTFVRISIHPSSTAYSFSGSRGTWSLSQEASGTRRGCLICSGEEEKPEVVHEQIREDAAHLSASGHRRVAREGRKRQDRLDLLGTEENGGHHSIISQLEGLNYRSSSMADIADSSIHTEDVTVYCKLCLSDCPAAETSSLCSCNCVFCTQCLRQYVQLAIRDGAGTPITCPDVACKHPGALLDSEIASFASDDQVKFYQRLKFERGVQLNPCKAWCPVLECQAVCSVNPSTKDKPMPIPCPTCHGVFCFACKEPWEEGHSCQQHQTLMVLPANDSALASVDPDPVIKQCPKCGVYIERNQGCAQMLCKSCKHTFCWYCLQNLDGDIFLRHYDKGPCRNKLGHSRASVMWNRTQVAGILVGMSIIVVVTSPLLLLASPCILCCMCKPWHKRNEKKKKKKKPTKETKPTDLAV